jgi:hypothetical protein
MPFPNQFQADYLMRFLLGSSKNINKEQKMLVSYLANDHLIEFHLIEIVIFHLIESFN